MSVWCAHCDLRMSAEDWETHSCQDSRHDAHYRSMTIEPMQYSLANQLDAGQHTIIKYVSRYRMKNGVRDLEAARDFLNDYIDYVKSEKKSWRGKPLERD